MRGWTRCFTLAAFVSVAASMEQPEACAELNTLGTLRVLRAAEDAGVGRLVFASSAAVYGDDPVIPKREELAPDPRSPYAQNQAGWGVLLRIVSPAGTPHDRLCPVLQRVRSAAGSGQWICRRGSAVHLPRPCRRRSRHLRDGTQTRDFVAASDIASGLLHLASRELSGPFNLGHGIATPIGNLPGRFFD